MRGLVKQLISIIFIFFVCAFTASAQSNNTTTAQTVKPVEVSQKTVLPFRLAEKFKSVQTIVSSDFNCKTTAYVDGENNSRFDLEWQGTPYTVLSRKSDGKVYILNTKEKTVRTLPINISVDDVAQIQALKNDLECEFLGNDKVDGKVAHKYHLTVANRGITVWLDSRDKVPYRLLDDQRQFEVVWQSYEPKAQAVSLFEVPSGYAPVQDGLMNVLAQMNEMMNKPGQMTDGLLNRFLGSKKEASKQ